MKTYCPICYKLKQMFKKGLAYRGYRGYYGGVADKMKFFRELHRKVHHKEATSGFNKYRP